MCTHLYEVIYACNLTTSRRSSKLWNEAVAVINLHLWLMWTVLCVTLIPVVIFCTCRAQDDFCTQQLILVIYLLINWYIQCCTYFDWNLMWALFICNWFDPIFYIDFIFILFFPYSEPLFSFCKMNHQMLIILVLVGAV